MYPNLLSQGSESMAPIVGRRLDLGQLPSSECSADFPLLLLRRG